MKENDMIWAQTIRNIVTVATGEFEDNVEQLKFISFMVSRFGGNYQTTDYCEMWAERIKRKATGRMDEITRKVYEEVYDL